MNANNAQNVTTGKPKIGGAVFRAPLGTTLPTTPTETLDAAFKNLGYVSEDGVTNDNSPASNTIKAWGGTVVINTQTERPDSYKLTLIEALNEDVLKTVYGDSKVTVNGNDIKVEATAEELPSCSWVIDKILKDGAISRTVIPCGNVSEVGTITYKDDEVVGYEITINDIADSTGTYHYEYIKLAAASI